MGELKKSITKDFLSSLEGISMFIASKMSSTALSGMRKSRAKGSSLEFSDFREYIPGDDIRRLDWNSYARFDRLFMRIFAEEKQADINIFVDISNSMSDEFQKSIFSRQIALAIAFIALKNTDKVNIFAFGNGILKKKLGLSSASRFYEAVDFLDNIENEGTTAVVKSMKEAFSDIKGKGVSYIISDFFSDDGYAEGLGFLLYKKQDVSCIQTLSKFDKEPDIYGNIRLVDSEGTNDDIDVFVSPTIIENYKKEFLNFQNQLGEFCRKRGIKFISVDNSEQVSKIVLKAL